MPREIRNRQRVSQACISCGLRKTKCDGAVPSCNQCTRNARPCHYGISMRNKTRKPSLIVGERTYFSSTRQPVNENDGQAASNSASATVGVWTRSDEEASSVMASLGGGRKHVDHHTEVSATNVSSTISARLFTAYFANIHPIWPILYMPMHDYGNSNLHSDAFAPAVLYAVYAIAACVEPTDASLSASPGDKTPSSAVFFEAALLALQKQEKGESRASTALHPLNFIRPSIESCQTLVILALQQHGLGEASNAAMLCNIAAGMAIEMRLNEARPLQTDYIDTQVASRLWWNLYVLDKVLACGLGRPITLRSEDVTTPYPSAAESDEYQLLQIKRASDGEIVRIKSHTMSGFNLTIDLCYILEDVLRTTCSVTSKQRICKDLEAAEVTRITLWARLQNCNEALRCSSIGVRTNGSLRSVVPPVAIIYAVWLYACTILLHRPFHFYWREYNWSPAHRLPPEHMPVQVCLAAAQELCAVLAGYVDDLSRLPCDVIFPIVLAAATLWQHRGEFSAGPDRAGVQQQIDLCVKCLSIVGKFWKNAGDCRRRLIRDFAGAASTPTPTMNDIQFRQQHNDHYNGQTVGLDSTPSGLANDAPIATLASVEETGQLSHTPVEATYPFLDALGSRLDEFTTADEGFRAYLESQLGQYDFPVF